MKKFLSVLLVFSLLVMAVGCTASAPEGTPEAPGTPEASIFTAGEYTASAQGNNGLVTVKVTFSDSAITSIEIVEHSETPGISDGALNDIPAAIVENQSLAVEAITGATYSSNAVLTAVEDCVKQAGGDAAVAKLKSAAVEAGEAEDKTYEADVVVLGAGGAGMAAAVTAHQAGKTVVVIEASGAMGGNTIMSGGALNASNDDYVPKTQMTDSYANSLKQALSETPINDDHAALIQAVQAEYDAYLASGSTALFDSVNWHILQTWRGGDFEGDLKLVRTLCENIWDGIEWIQSLGMGFLDGEFTVTGGLWPRAHKPVDPVGTGFFKTYQAYVDNNEGITMVYNTTAKELIVENGRVVGANCIANDGSKITAKGSSVVLATGGFSRNVELRQKYNAETNKWPTLDESILSTNAPTINGDGIFMATAVGAAVTQMHNIQMLPLGDPVTGALSGNIEHDVETRIFVNKEGKRFVNEGGRRDDMTLALFEQTDRTLFIIMDSDTYPTGDELNNFGETVNSLVEAGRAYKADTLEELAAMIGVPAENLVASVNEFNRYAKGGDREGQVDEFGRSLFSTPIDNGPFYAGARVPTVHHTMGGVVIDENCHVLDESGNIIPGLYAAGEVTGGIHGANRLGGNALADTIVFGRIAGRNAAAE
ncbi:MAG: flavocytochrome c [Christensenellales bacterium]